MSTILDEAFAEAKAKFEQVTRNGSKANGQRHDDREHKTDAKPSWQEPDWSMLDDRRGELPAFPLDALTTRWREWTIGASHGAGVMPEHVMVPLLSVASSTIGAARRVRPSRSWSEPLSLWTAIVGFSGTGKTPGLAVTTRALSAIERNRRAKIADLRREHDGRVEAARAVENNGRRQSRRLSRKACRRHQCQPRQLTRASSCPRDCMPQT